MMTVAEIEAGGDDGAGWEQIDAKVQLISTPVPPRFLYSLPAAPVAALVTDCGRW